MGAVGELTAPAGDFNLLVSSFSRAPGRARREILSRLRALGDPAPDITQTVARGILAVRTNLDPRAVVRTLGDLCERSPQAFRFTCKWVPVDRWAPPDLEAMKEAVAGLRDRIGPGETWRMTVERRGETSLDPAEVIRTLAALIDARVDLAHPAKVLLVELFGTRVALSVLGTDDVFSVVKVQAERAPSPEPAPGEGSTGEPAREGGHMWRYRLLCVSPPGREQSQIRAWETQLNELGGEGWEAVAVIQQGDSWWVLFKMPHVVASF